jgi:hypothetical protein
VVQGNIIGTDVTGTQSLPNGDVGIALDSSSNNNLIGGTAVGAGNLISGNKANGIDIAFSNNNTIQGNTIGTDVTGKQPLANNGYGISISAGSGNVIGGTAAGAGNLLSGNKSDGLYIANGATRTLVQGNTIGTNAAGTAAVANGGNGITIAASANTIGGTAAGAGNLISGNFLFGIALSGTNNLVQGNLIGTDITGTQPLGSSSGVSITAGGNTIGGTVSGARNVISGNADGLELLSGSGTVVEGNYIGTDITGTQAVANIRGIYVRASGDTIGGTAAGAGNVISGNLNNGVELDQGATNDLVESNLIGTDVTGTAPLGNGGIGIAIGASGNTIGGTVAGAGNVISANQAGGLEIFTGSGNRVQGNLIGTDASGTVALGNFIGVLVGNPVGGNTIGGTASGAGNVISGNQASGVLLASNGNIVQGNLIGTDITGTQALGNNNGLSLQGSNNTIGGTASGAGNVISGNRANGILSFGTSEVIQGNFIGTDITGTQALGNGGDGVSAGSNTTIGGTAAGAGNVISANAGNGISLAGNGNLVLGNLIGTDITGTQALSNGGNGVSITGSNNTIGGTAAGAGNTIAFNGNDGVLVDTGTGNAILSDLVFANGNLGIELIHNGNNNQAAPVLTGAFPDGSNTVIQGVLQSTPNTTFTVQLFADASIDPSGLAEGQQLLGTVTVTTDAFGFAAFTVTIPQVVPAGQAITAAATDPNGNTSEFSLPVEVSNG